MIKNLVRRFAGFGKMDSLMLLATFIWGGNYTLVKLFVKDVTPEFLNCYRLVLASIALFIYIKITNQTVRIQKKHLPRFFLSAFFLFIYQLCFTFGIYRTMAWKVSILMATMPLFISIFSYIIRDEIASFAVWIGLFFSLVGVFFITVNTKSVGGFFSSGEELIGNLFATFSAILWAAYSVTAKPLVNIYSPLAFSTYTLGLVSLFFIPLLIIDIKNQNPNTLTFAPLGALSISALLAIAFGSVIWYKSVDIGGNIRTSIYSNISPLWGVIVAIIVLGESFTNQDLLGSLLIVAGIILSKAKIKMKQPGFAANTER